MTNSGAAEGRPRFIRSSRRADDYTPDVPRKARSAGNPPFTPAARRGNGAAAVFAAAPMCSLYEVAADGSRPAAPAGRLCRKSETDATATQSSQTIIVKKTTEKIAATPATKPNQLTQRGKIA